MTGKDLFTQINNGNFPQRIPFVPTIYEHCASLLIRTPSQLAQNENLLVKGHLRSFELYQHDLVTVGLDVYNIESEALGAKIVYHDNNQLPSCKKPIVNSSADFLKLSIPNPLNDARMPMMLNATRRVMCEIGHLVPVSGTIVGPFTLAAILRGFEAFTLDMIDDPDFALEQIAFAKEVGIRYAKAFHKLGVGIAINDSWIAPPLLSPSMYKIFAFPAQCDMISQLKTHGITSISLISGGNTTSIVEDLVKTGTSLIMADSCCDFPQYKKLCQQHDIVLRANINPQIVKDADSVAMQKFVQTILSNCHDYHKFVFGCGIVSYDTRPQSVLTLKKLLLEQTEHFRK